MKCRHVLALLLVLPFGTMPPARAQGRPKNPAGDDVKELVRGNTAFALDLYARLR